MLKRLFDLLIASAGLLVLSPLFIVISIAIKVSSPGPAFYRALRVGKYSRRFVMLKFRTMVLNAESIGGVTTGRNDPRITNVGHFLRKCKLDEMPQLFNVIKNDMSLVGPRPEVEEHTSCYSEEEKLILTVKPGLTDLASIGFRNLSELVGDEDPHGVFLAKYRHKKNRLRLRYVRNQSFGLDMKILWLTILAVFRTR